MPCQVAENMPVAANRIYEEALSLPIDDRLLLIDKLIHSTNLPVENELEEIWMQEIQTRVEDLENGNAKLIAGEEVFKKIQDRFCD